MEEEEEITVHIRSDDRICFESPLVQSIADKIDFLWDESKELLEEFNSSELKEQIDEFDIEEFAENAINQIDDIFDDVSKFKERVIEENLPGEIEVEYRNTLLYLNYDEDYVMKARRKLERVKENKVSDPYKTNYRIIELCDKAIDIRITNFDAYTIKAQALVNLGKYDDAIEAYIHALSIRDDVDVWLAIANVNRLNGEFEDAIDVYGKALLMDRNSFVALKEKACTYFEMGEYKKADRFFKKADSIQNLDDESKAIWDKCLENI